MQSAHSQLHIWVKDLQARVVSIFTSTKFLWEQLLRITVTILLITFHATVVSVVQFRIHSYNYSKPVQVLALIFTIGIYS